MSKKIVQTAADIAAKWPKDPSRQGRDFHEFLTKTLVPTIQQFAAGSSTQVSLRSYLCCCVTRAQFAAAEKEAKALQLLAKNAFKTKVKTCATPLSCDHVGVVCTCRRYNVYGTIWP